MRSSLFFHIIVLPILTILFVLQKPSRGPQGYQRYRTSGRGTIANQWKRKKKTTSINKQFFFPFFPFPILFVYLEWLKF